jgi:hypothetical protein
MAAASLNVVVASVVRHFADHDGARSTRLGDFAANFGKPARGVQISSAPSGHTRSANIRR